MTINLFRRHNGKILIPKHFLNTLCKLVIIRWHMTTSLSRDSDEVSAYFSIYTLPECVAIIT